MTACARCGCANLGGVVHSFGGDPCSGIPRAPHVESHEAYHERARHSTELFATFEQIGSQPSEDAATGKPVTLLLANCPSCHTTISRTVAYRGPDVHANSIRRESRMQSLVESLRSGRCRCGAELTINDTNQCDDCAVIDLDEARDGAADDRRDHEDAFHMEVA